MAFKEFVAALLLIGYLSALVISLVRWQGLQHVLRERIGHIAVVTAGFVIFWAFGGWQLFASAIMFAIILAIPGGLFAGPFGAILMGTIGLVGGFCYGFTLIGQ